MPRIAIHQELSASPKVVVIPGGKTKMRLRATGPADAVIDLSVAKKAPVRFVNKGTTVRLLRGKVSLSAKPKLITRNIELCRTVSDIRDWVFTITVTIRKVDGNGNTIEKKHAKCGCAFLAKVGAATCV